MFIALSGRHAGRTLYVERSILGDLFVPFRESTGSSVVQISVTLLCLMMLRTVISGWERRLLQSSHTSSAVFFVEHTVITEIFLQLQMAPVEERIADGFASTSAHFKISLCRKRCL